MPAIPCGHVLGVYRVLIRSADKQQMRAMFIGVFRKIGKRIADLCDLRIGQRIFAEITVQRIVKEQKSVLSDNDLPVANTVSFS